VSEPTKPELPARGAGKFEEQMASGFVQKSLSPATRQTYHRAVRDFFAFVDWAHPTEVTPDDVRRWRDELLRRGRRPATVALKLSVVRSLFEYLRAGGLVALNPASARLVPAPALPEQTSGRALSPKQVHYLLAGPDRATPSGARDYALLLVLLRLGLRVAEACSLRASSIHEMKGRWVVKVRVKGGRERLLPLPEEVKAALDAYLALDAGRRKLAHSDGPDAHLFQPLVNYRTLVFDKPLTTRQAEKVVGRWAEFAGLGRVTPHDLRRTAVTRALEQGLSYRQVQMMSGHRDPKTVMRYDHGRENLDLNAVNFLDYSDREPPNGTPR
jgi:site-specific recombinase XerD